MMLREVTAARRSPLVAGGDQDVIGEDGGAEQERVHHAAVVAPRYEGNLLGRLIYRRTMARHLQLLRAILLIAPVGALSLGVPFVNRIEPTILGLPFILAWIIAWIALTPVFLWSIGRLERRW